MTPPAPCYKIAAIPADGIGPEVIGTGIKVLNKLAATLKTFELAFENFECSSTYYKKHGRYLPDGALDVLRKSDVILFGAVRVAGVICGCHYVVGHIQHHIEPKVAEANLIFTSPPSSFIICDNPDVHTGHISLWGLRLVICQPLQQYTNARPTTVFHGTQPPLRACQPGDLDWPCREGVEVATEVSIFTRHGVERIMKFAFEIARRRPKKHISVATKSNAQRKTGYEVAAEVAEQFPDGACDKMLVDAMTAKMVLKPESLDTIVATNLHVDILSDLATALVGSIGIAPTNNLDPTRKKPSMFEPIHGSAFDITGKVIGMPIFGC
ncbi:tartrate dehydrogenase/decarboxylase/D-malate dehydrogenase [[Emmonsia] crescens]|uniref:Tartrate dehydrogenase/decarboxylase/D-malate dehydrogenase n=1 Tax=[Emmonsia] crescens TaxID=73230 RepID=A0A2B7ZAF8_9EURO|nr:tartrate dehydrogenase/decarboxylase/D-malate dehydrogenase [Emmonsia crescens]